MVPNDLITNELKKKVKKKSEEKRGKKLKRVFCFSVNFFWWIALVASRQKESWGTNNATGHEKNSSASNATKNIPKVSCMSKVI